MLKTGRRFLALLLCLMMIGLAACGKNDGGSSRGENSDNGSKTPSAMGRYVESEEPLPEGIAAISAMAQFPDGTLRMLGDSSGQGIGPWSVLSSSDGGKSWTNVEYPWLDQLSGSPILGAALSTDGVYIAHMANAMEEAPPETEETEGQSSDTSASDVATDASEATEAAADTEAATAENAFNPEYTFVYGDMTSLTEIPFKPVPEDESMLTTKLQMASNGDLLAIGTVGTLQIDTDAWKVKNTFQNNSAVSEKVGAATYGSTLAIHSADKIKLYDMDTGSSKEEIPTTAGASQTSYMTQKSSLVTVPTDGSAYFYSNDSGLYRVPMDTTVSERLVDGELSSFGLPTLNYNQIFIVGSDEYLALATTQDIQSKLFRYTYNPDIPSEPDKVIKVYSLYDNKTIRQSIGQFQLKRPDVKVSYQVGIDGNGSVTAADAMRSLSTELLAGKGPDVIVMDDMPVDSYIQKNVLYDMSELIQDGDYLSNITETFRKDGKLYAIPARFYLPVLLGDDIDSVKNLNDFVSWLGKQPTYDIGIPAEKIIERFYAACSYRWFNEDGSLNEQSFKNDLEQLGALAEGIRGVGEIQSYNNTAIDTLLWYGGAISANYGMLTGYMDVTLFDAAIRNRPAGSYHTFPNDSGDIYIPGTVMGINAASTELDIAKEFVKYTLTEDVQATHLGDGFPVNTKAFNKLSEDPSGENQDAMIAAITVKDAKTGEMKNVELSSAWPSTEFMDSFKSMLSSVTTPIKNNAVIREMVIDETAGYISGTKTLDDTVRSFKEKMDIYLAE